MREIHPSDANLAFLYASGEMDAAEAAAFERRLGEEQPLREALCQAIELLYTLEGRTPLTPRPAYRQRVRQRLRPRGLWQRFTDQRTYQGHPMFWSGLGAVAALLMVLLMSPGWWPTSQPATREVPVAEQSGHGAAEVPRDAPAGPTTIEMAETWAGLDYSDHLLRAHEEESRRRDRRLAWEEHAHHLPGAFGVNH
jgi:anti-sigma-K factor RskA